MAKEVLYISEEDLPDVIKVIEAGLKACKIRRNLSAKLKFWCQEEKEYIEMKGERA